MFLSTTQTVVLPDIRHIASRARRELWSLDTALLEPPAHKLWESRGHTPDVLRKLLKNFRNEDACVKLQIRMHCFRGDSRKLRCSFTFLHILVLNLAVKLFLANSAETAKLFKYTRRVHTLDLCKYDTNYDLRDRMLPLLQDLVDHGTQSTLAGRPQYLESTSGSHEVRE